MENRIPGCRVAIVGAQRARVAKVVSLISPEERILTLKVDTEVNGVPPNGKDKSLLPQSVRIEYLPCVATFDSYENESGQLVRYLSSLEYHGTDGKRIRGSSLAPFFDQVLDENEAPRFPGVAAVAIGCGIESKDDVAAIETLLTSFCVTEEAESGREALVVETVTPNPEYSSMKHENDAYKALDSESKTEAIRLRTIGPGKMAQFAVSLATQVVHDTYPEFKPNASDTVETPNQSEDTCIRPTCEEETNGDAIHCSDGAGDNSTHENPSKDVIDERRTRYACRRCRTFLFGEADLEDPSHARAIHGFTRRKSGQPYRGVCESLFLAGGIDWMGDMSAVEGKFACPKCASKLGSWKWAGTQCSCGTWVTPAIQVPSSKVDMVQPALGGLPPGTVISPTINY